MTTSHSQKHNYVIIEQRILKHTPIYTWAVSCTQTKPGRKMFIMITIYSQILFLSLLSLFLLLLLLLLLFQLYLTCIVECWKTWIFTLPSPPCLPSFSFIHFHGSLLFIFPMHLFSYSFLSAMELYSMKNVATRLKKSLLAEVDLRTQC